MRRIDRWTRAAEALSRLQRDYLGYDRNFRFGNGKTLGAMMDGLEALAPNPHPDAVDAIMDDDGADTCVGWCYECLGGQGADGDGAAFAPPAQELILIGPPDDEERQIKLCGACLLKALQLIDD